MTFEGEYFQQKFGIMMESSVPPILANIYMAKRENILKAKCKSDVELKWSILFRKVLES